MKILAQRSNELSLKKPDHEGTLNVKYKAFKRFSTSACMAMAVFLSAPATTVAQENSAQDALYESGAERIDVVDRMRMQSQRISALSCMYDAGINVEQSKAAIEDAVAEYDALLSAIRDGAPALNINIAEDDRRMLSNIRGLGLQWENFKQAVNLRMDSQVETVGPDYVSRQNLNLMHSSKILVSETIAHYAIPPALLQNDAFTLLIAARQRTLSQQIAKEACAIITGNDTMGRAARLANATNRFDASHNALLNGFEGAGISPAPTPEIREGLLAMTSDWVILREQLAQVSSNTSTAQVSEIYEQLDDVVVQLDAIIPLYIAESK